MVAVGIARCYRLAVTRPSANQPNQARSRSTTTTSVGWSPARDRKPCLVIAETTALIPIRQIAVTDERGRYVFPTAEGYVDERCR